MQTIWFVIALVFLILSVAGLVTAAVLCFCRQRAATPRHPHNAHNAQTHPPVSFPCEFRKKRAPRNLLPRILLLVASVVACPSTPSSRSFPVSYGLNQSTMKFPPFLHGEPGILSSNWKLKGQSPAFSWIFAFVRFCFCFLFLRSFADRRVEKTMDLDEWISFKIRKV